MKLDIDGIQAFVQVAALGGFYKAADKLNLSQTALTRRIQKLEAYLGLRLLDRTTRSVALTAVGREFLPQAARLVRASMLEVLGQPYIRTASAKGVPWRAVVTGHALPNAAIPTVTIIGFMIGSLIAGAVVVESVFSWPGLGRLLVHHVADPALTGRQQHLGTELHHRRILGPQLPLQGHGLFRCQIPGMHGRTPPCSRFIVNAANKCLQKRAACPSLHRRSLTCRLKRTSPASC